MLCRWLEGKERGLLSLDRAVGHLEQSPNPSLSGKIFSYVWRRNPIRLVRQAQARPRDRVCSEERRNQGGLKEKVCARLAGLSFHTKKNSFLLPGRAKGPPEVMGGLLEAWAATQGWTRFPTCHFCCRRDGVGWSPAEMGAAAALA